MNVAILDKKNRMIGDFLISILISIYLMMGFFSFLVNSIFHLQPRHGVGFRLSAVGLTPIKMTLPNWHVLSAWPSKILSDLRMTNNRAVNCNTGERPEKG